MNIIFCNTLQKPEAEDRAVSGQVSIAERQGVWHVLWNQDTTDGHSLQEMWYEGATWKDTLDAFRGGVQQKLEEGYVPLIEGIDIGKRVFHAGSYAQRLLYYSETNGNEELYERLKQWRREQSAKDGRSAFIVAPNRVLKMLSAFVPHNEEELQQIPGFGKQRIRLYGDSVLECLRQFAQPEAFPLQWVRDKLNMAQFQRWLWEETERRHLAEEEKRQKLLQMKQLIQQGCRLAEMEEHLQLERRELVALLEELDKEGSDVADVIDQEMKERHASEWKRAVQAFEKLGDRYLKPVMAELYPDAKMNDKELASTYEWLRLCRLKYRREQG
ncbi:HRDC domain-containing protein [Paenibacillus senegalensis]|uniref:HRDC domain-containing protein n=1 Tax=Paenibacillus senegalensis TaxID=1465766 RepID=UPI000289FD3F|nr:HRDC domain-containing protein [Paenibacillus senegalensis]